MRVAGRLPEDFAALLAYWALAMAQPPSPSWRTLAGVGLILLLIVVMMALVAILAPTVGTWPVLVQAAFYIVVVILWLIPLKPLVRWMVTGSFRTRS